MPWEEPKENKDLRDLITRAINLALFYGFEKTEEKLIEIIPSIRVDTMFVELYFDGKVIYQTSSILPDGEFDDIKLERDLLEEIMVKIMAKSIESFLYQHE